MGFLFNKWKEDGSSWTRNEGTIDDKLNIPKRGLAVVKSSTKTKDIYQFYKENIKSVPSIITGEKTLGKYNISSKLYSNIIKDINKEIIKLMILENFEYKLPYRLGLLSIKQKKIKFELDEKGELKTKKLSLDFKATKDLWKEDEEAKKNKSLIFYTNEHTNGNKVSWWWSKKGASTLGIKVYYFKPCREMSRTPAKYLKDKSLNLQFYETPIKKQYMLDLNFNKNK